MSNLSDRRHSPLRAIISVERVLRTMHQGRGAYRVKWTLACGHVVWDHAKDGNIARKLKRCPRCRELQIIRRRHAQ